MNQAEIVRLARIGAEARIAQLQAEITAIRRQFPGSARAGAAVDGAARKPRQMSAAARRRISQAAKKRWEQWRKEHGK